MLKDRLIWELVKWFVSNLGFVIPLISFPSIYKDGNDLIKYFREMKSVRSLPLDSSINLDRVPLSGLREEPFLNSH